MPYAPPRACRASWTPRGSILSSAVQNFARNSVRRSGRARDLARRYRRGTRRRRDHYRQRIPRRASRPPVGKTGRGWIERAVDIGPDGTLRFTHGTARDLDITLTMSADAAPGAIFETSPVTLDWTRRVAARLTAHGGAAFGDRLRPHQDRRRRHAAGGESAPLSQPAGRSGRRPTLPPM